MPVVPVERFGPHDLLVAREKRCIDEKAHWSYRASLEKEGCCKAVTDPNGPTTTLEVAHVDTWRELTVPN